MSFTILFLFLLGTIIGSFLNVFILRYGTGKGLSGRSQCASCGHKLSAFDLIPVFSYLFLKGHCRYCKTKISATYPIVELATGILFALLGFRLFMTPINPESYLLLFVWMIFWGLALAISVYDLRHGIIPNSWVLFLAVLSIVYTFFVRWGTGTILYSLFSGVIFFLFFFLIWLVSRGKWMGLGDAKFAFPLGVFVGLPGLFSAWALSFWIGTILVLIYTFFEKFMLPKGKRLRAIGKPITMKTEIPFGPFLFLGTLAVFLGLVLPIYGL